jgi:hypothetical protein
MALPFARLANPTGGWWWHARAWRHQRLWAPTTRQIQDWCLQTAPDAERLVVIGASAGWMISDAWLTRHREVETWDIDPWAQRLFEWRHGKTLRAAGVRWTHHQGDAWQHSAAWLRARHESVYWFDNVLGQLRFALPMATARERIESVKHQMRGTRWGSVHDRYSGPMAHTTEADAKPWRSNSGIDLEDRAAQNWLCDWGAQAPWLDHLTEGVFQTGTPVLNLGWPIQPRFGHWLELGWQLP